jgi:FixJ family two-component response regulator
MPDVSGIELAKLLSDKINNVSIIMMSSLGMEHIVIESISNGAIDFLHKPFDAKTLLKAVGKISQQNLNEG